MSYVHTLYQNMDQGRIVRIGICYSILPLAKGQRRKPYRRCQSLYLRAGTTVVQIPLYPVVELLPTLRATLIASLAYLRYTWLCLESIAQDKDIALDSVVQRFSQISETLVESEKESSLSSLMAKASLAMVTLSMFAPTVRLRIYSSIHWQDVFLSMMKLLPSYYSQLETSLTGLSASDVSISN